MFPENTLIKQKRFIILEPKEIELSKAVDTKKTQKIKRKAEIVFPISKFKIIGLVYVSLKLF